MRSTSWLDARTPQSHRAHIKLGVKHCGCMVHDTPKDMVKKCPCGAAYDNAIISSIRPFTCYDCKRPL